MTISETSWVHPLILEKKNLDVQEAQLKNLQVTNEKAIETAVKQAAYRAVINIVWWVHQDAVMRWKINQIKNLTGSNYTTAYTEINWEGNPSANIDNDPFIGALQEIKKMNNSNGHIDVTNRSRNGDEGRGSRGKEELVISVQWKVVDLLWLLDKPPIE